MIFVWSHDRDIFICRIFCRPCPEFAVIIFQAGHCQPVFCSLLCSGTTVIGLDGIKSPFSTAYLTWLSHSFGGSELVQPSNKLFDRYSICGQSVLYAS